MSSARLIDMTRLKRGQIVARKYFEFWDSVSLKLGKPRTDFVHFSILAVPFDRDDWLVFDTPVHSSMALIPLSRFSGQAVRIYSAKNGDADYAYQEADKLLKAGTPYEGLGGWNYVFRIIPSLLAYWLSHGPGPVPWDMMPNIDRPDSINCLVLVRRCYPDLIPSNCCASAGAFEQAYRDGKLELQQEGIIP